jgi:hypothetical protein
LEGKDLEGVFKFKTRVRRKEDPLLSAVLSKLNG